MRILREIPPPLTSNGVEFGARVERHEDGDRVVTPWGASEFYHKIPAALVQLRDAEYVIFSALTHEDIWALVLLTLAIKGGVSEEVLRYYPCDRDNTLFESLAYQEAELAAADRRDRRRQQLLALKERMISWLQFFSRSA